jgi:hypothetical protein
LSHSADDHAEADKANDQEDDTKQLHRMAALDVLIGRW